jgi:hypothetical protein
MKIRKTLLSSVVVAAAAVLLSPISALAASYTDSVGGIEVFATSTTGVFTGTAGGALPGVWSATVHHTPLGTSAAITGGSFDVVSVFGGLPAVVAGSFNGGSVAQTGGFSGCGNQTFDVNGSLVSVGVSGGPHTGKGTFDAVLTHLRFSLFGKCITYGATIKGAVSLSF